MGRDRVVTHVAWWDGQSSFGCDTILLELDLVNVEGGAMERFLESVRWGLG